MSSEITPEDAIKVARAAGLDTSGLEEQVAKKAEAPDLAGKIERLEAALERRVPEPPASPEQRERAVADRLRDHMNASVTQWFAPGGGNHGR